jgi:hypothetical protein
MRPTVPLERVFELGMDRKIQPWLSASWQEGTEPEGLQVNLGGGHRKPMPTGTRASRHGMPSRTRCPSQMRVWQ